MKKTWRTANRLLGHLTFPLVLAMTILYFLLDRAELILLAGVLLWIGIPAVYFLIQYNSRKKEGEALPDGHPDEPGKKYTKINFVIILLMFLVSAVMLFFLPEEIPILHSGATSYPIPTVFGVWLIPVVALVLNLSFMAQKRASLLNSAVMFFC